jgi:hypothetical protein
MNNSQFTSSAKMQLAISFVTGKLVTPDQADKIIETLNLLNDNPDDFSIKMAKEKLNFTPPKNTMS